MNEVPEKEIDKQSPVPDRFRAFSLKQMAEILSVSEQHVGRLVRSGELESIKIGRRRLIPSISFQKWLENGLKKLS